MYIIYNQDGSIRKVSLNDFIQKGNDGVNSIFLGIKGLNNHEWAAGVLFTLPNDQTEVITPLALNQQIDGETYSGWNVSIPASVTLYTGDVKFSVQAVNLQNQVLFTSEGKLVINPSSIIPDETNITLSQYNALLQLVLQTPTSLTTIKVLNNIATEDLSAYSEGQIFLSRADHQLYILTNNQVQFYSLNYVTETTLAAALSNYITSDALTDALSGYVSNSDLTTALGSYVKATDLTNTLTNYVTNATLNTRLNSYVTSSSLSTTLNNYVTSSGLSTALSSYVTIASLNTTLNGYVTSGSLATTLADYVKTTALSSYATQQWVNQTLGSYVTTTSLSNTLSSYVTGNQMQSAISAALSSALSYKGKASVATLNGYGTTSSNGSLYVLTDSGTLTQGSVSVIAGDQVAWNSSTSQWDKLAAAIDTSNFVTTTDLNTALNSYVLTSSLSSTLANYVTATDLSTAIADFVTTSSLNSTLSSYVTTNSLNSALSSYVTSSDLATTLSGYATTTDLNNAIANFVTSSDLSTALAAYVTSSDLSTTLAGYVQAVAGKGLSSNDYTTADQTKLSGIESGAQVNVLEGISVNGTPITIQNKIANITGLVTSTYVDDRVNRLQAINLTSVSVYTFLQTYGLETLVQGHIDVSYLGTKLVGKIHVETTNIYSTTYSTSVIIETDTNSFIWNVTHTGPWSDNAAVFSISFGTLGNAIKGQAQTFGGTIVRYNFVGKRYYLHKVTVSGTMLTNYFTGRLLQSTFMGTSPTALDFTSRELGFSSSSSFTFVIETRYSSDITSLSDLFTAINTYDGKIIEISNGNSHHFGVPVRVLKTNSTYTFHFQLEMVYSGSNGLDFSNYLIFYTGNNVSSMFTDVKSTIGYLVTQS